MHGRAWREELRDFLQQTKSELTIVCPYIRKSEAEFVTGELSEKIRISTLTCFNADSIISGALEIKGVKTLANFSPESKAINLPQLHAKVFVADTSQAIITSANLTSSGIDRNYEYGITVKGSKPVSKICDDLENYKRIGTEITEFDRIEDFANSAKKAHGRAEKKITDETRKLKNAIKSLENECLAIQVGERSTTGLFSDSLLYVLNHYGPSRTNEIQDRIRKLYPQLCEDNRNRIIKGLTFGKLWKHHLRNAQQAMKRQGKIKYDGNSGLWSLVQ